jgi:hypothetical protein
LRSSASWIIARSSRAPQPRYIANIDLRGTLEVQDGELATDVPVGHALVLGVRAGVVALGAKDDVVGLARAVGAVVARDVGNAQEQLAQLFGEPIDLVAERLLLVPELAALGLQRLGLGSCALSPQATDVGRQRAHLMAQRVALGCDLALALVERDDRVERGHLVAPAGQSGAHAVQVVPDASQVEHPRTLQNPGSPAVRVAS